MSDLLLNFLGTAVLAAIGFFFIAQTFAPEEETLRTWGIRLIGALFFGRYLWVNFGHERFAEVEQSGISLFWWISIVLVLCPLVIAVLLYWTRTFFEPPATKETVYPQ